MKKMTRYLPGLILFLSGFFAHQLIDRKPAASPETPRPPVHKDAHQTPPKPDRTPTFSAHLPNPPDADPIAHALFSDQELAAAEQAMQQSFIEALIKQNPAQASALLDQMPIEEQRKYSAQLAVAWMNSDPVGGLNWMLEHHSSFGEAEYEYRMGPMLVALALEAPGEALAYFETTRALEHNEELCVNLAKGLAKQNFDDAFTFLKTLPKRGISDNALVESYTKVMSMYAAHDPIAAARVVQELDSPELQSELLEPIVDSFAQDDIEVTLDWILGLDHEEARTAGIEQLSNAYGYQNPAGILAGVMENQSRLSEAAVVNAFDTYAAAEPEEAALLVDQLNPEFQKGATQKLLRNWLSENEADAMSWLNAQPDGTAFEAGAGVAAQHYAKNGHADMALEWASLVGDPAEQYNLYSSILAGADASQMNNIEQLLSYSRIPEPEKARLRRSLQRRMEDDNASLILPMQ